MVQNIRRKMSMLSHLTTTLSLLSLASALPSTLSHQKSPSIPLVFDGRVPKAATGATFDAGLLPYNAKYDLGANLTWSDVLLFPKVQTSLFDNSSTKAVEVTIDDRAIFTPSPTNVQAGFRRNELLPQPANATYATTGIKTLHFSLQPDSHRRLNYSPEYQLVWLESQDYSADQFSLNVGTIFGTKEAHPKRLQLRGTSNASPQQTLWSAPFDEGVWHNLALVLDFNKNALKVYYSKECENLEAVTGLISNDLSNLGQYHFGILKKPTGQNLTDITRQGFQEKGIHEGIVYGGILEEDSKGGLLSVAPGKTVKY
nr:hypothetical protein B0A51_15907 [Rachicladosporium sp. CCFEE 5018]